MRLIDADALKKEIHKYTLDIYCINLENSKEFAGYSTVENYCEGLYEATELIDNLPTVDAVKVVRCIDCKYHEDEEPGVVYCPRIIGGWTTNNFFCAAGERRNDD